RPPIRAGVPAKLEHFHPAVNHHARRSEPGQQQPVGFALSISLNSRRGQWLRFFYAADRHGGMAAAWHRQGKWMAEGDRLFGKNLVLTVLGRKQIVERPNGFGASQPQIPSRPQGVM